jgi:hypothetical protein
MKKLVLSTLLGLAAVISSPASALTAASTFTVKVNLYPVCKFVTAPTGQLDLRYVSLQTSDSSNTMDFQLACTAGQVYGLSFAPAGGTVVGLNYTLATTLAGTATASGTGTGTTEDWKIKGTIVGGQAGTCATSVNNTATT